MRSFRWTGALVVAVVLAVAASGPGQTIAPPTPISPAATAGAPATAPGTGLGTAPAAVAPGTATTGAGTAAAVAPASPGWTSPLTRSTLSPTTSTPSPGVTTFAQGGSPYAPPTSPYLGTGSVYAPGSTTIVPNGPAATLEGSIGPPPPNWDPYAAPGQQAPSLLPSTPAYGEFAHDAPPTTGRRFLDNIAVNYMWMLGNGGDELGINHVELSTTLAFPFLWNAQCPLLVTPGFGTWWWNGPTTPFDMPPRTYDAYLDFAWNPRVTQWLGGELDFRVGVYSDFNKVSTLAIRPEGKGLAVLTLNQSFQFKFGIWYLNRNRVKILPAGGIVWTPNSDVRFEILFPNPRLAQRLTTWGTTEWWWYVRGEYGGGAWEITRDPVMGGFVDRVDYNDIEVTLGLEFKALSGLTGYFEAGLAFNRELFYVSRDNLPDDTDGFFRPNTAFMLRAGIAY